MSLSSLLVRALSDPLNAVGSRRAIGYLGWNVPVELILAADAVPVQLGALPGCGTELADRFLENSFSAQSRIVAQRWLDGGLDALDAVIFSRSDDNAQRLYYYLCELQRVGVCKGPKPLLYDLARIQRGTSVAHTMESTRALAAALRVDESRLPAAMERVAVREKMLAELSKRRTADEVPLGSVAYRIERGARTDWSEEFDRSLQEWLSNCATGAPRKRVLLVGSAPADDRVHNAIEVDGTVVVGEINEASFLAPRAAVSGDSVETIARRYYDRTNAISTLLQSPADLVSAARALRADGVIVWMVATDTGLAWQAPRIERALREASLPTLMLTSKPQTLNADTLDQIAQFRRTLEVA
ncbi:2-hydroxyacyl-CoA dehydratase [Steroidobacter flavus]|uniref:2-hydroxyacyl-CoA dehydratase n=1 Tax=Steroidobacter flavus TaxID=1842136 RepID=A0ABV8SZV6_9GAMM